MYNIRNLEYRVTLYRENGDALPLTDIATDLTWGDYDKELAARASVTVPNIQYQGEYMTDILKLNGKLTIEVNVGNGFAEIYRGNIFRKSYTCKGERSISVSLFDDVYFLQLSKEQRYVAKGTSCGSAISRILSDWNVPSFVLGPSTSVGMHLFRSNTIADEINTLLDEVERKGAERHFIRCQNGKVYVMPYGSNQDVPVIDLSSTEDLQDDQSIENPITRVKILLNIKEDETSSATQAVLTKNTNFGIFQDIMYVSKDDSLSEAKEEAQKTLDENAVPKHTLSLPSVPDIPYLRKGDKFKLEAGEISGYYYVKSVQHNALRKTMSIEVDIK